MAGKSKGRGARNEPSGMPGGDKRSNRGRGGGGGSDERSGYSAKIRERQVAKNSKKGGCVPKLFMFALPFMAAGTYLAYLAIKS